MNSEIEKRVVNANRSNYAFLPLIKSQSVLRAEKIEIYKTLKADSRIPCRAHAVPMPLRV
jgi:hypothetical protein